MSFSEVHHTKTSLLIDLTPDGSRVEAIEAPVPRPLATVRGRIEDLLTSREFTHAESAWCQVTLTDPQRPVGAMDRLRTRFPHTLELRFEPEGLLRQPRSYAARVSERSDLDVCCDFLEHVRSGAPAEAAERELLDEALGLAREARDTRGDEGRVGAA
jgi:exonuclease SbcD